MKWVRLRRTRVQFPLCGRGATVNALAMPSNYEAPELRKQLSARIRQSTHTKLANIREIWRELAREKTIQKLGESPEEFKARIESTVDAIDLTHVVDVLLASACDTELGQFGGHASTPEKLAAQLKAIKTAAKQSK